MQIQQHLQPCSFRKLHCSIQVGQRWAMVDVIVGRACDDPVAEGDTDSVEACSGDFLERLACVLRGSMLVQDFCFGVCPRLVQGSAQRPLTSTYPSRERSFGIFKQRRSGSRLEEEPST